MYRTALKCPVCGRTMDTITHPNPDIDAQVLALLGNDARGYHLDKSRNCSLDNRWYQCWITETVKGEEAEEDGQK